MLYKKYQTGVQKVVMPPGAESYTGITGVGGVADRFTGQPWGAVGDGLGQVGQQLISDNKAGSKKDVAGATVGGALQWGGTAASVALNPAVLGATGGLSAAAVPIAMIAGGIKSNIDAKHLEREQKQAENFNEYADDMNTFVGQEAGYIEPTTTNTFGRTLYGDMAPQPIMAKHGVHMQGYKKYNNGVYQLTADFAGGPSHEQGGIKYIAPVPSRSGMVSKPIEVEGGELELTSIKDGSKTIIPKNKASKARSYLKNGNDLALQTLIDTLPTESEATMPMMRKGGKIYAKDGVKNIGGRQYTMFRGQPVLQTQEEIDAYTTYLKNKGKSDDKIQAAIDRATKSTQKYLTKKGVTPGNTDAAGIDINNPWASMSGNVFLSDPFEGLPEAGTTTIDGVVDEEGEPVQFDTYGGKIYPDWTNQDYYKDYLVSQGKSPEDAQAEINALSEEGVVLDTQWDDAREVDFQNKKGRAIADGGGTFTDSYGQEYEFDQYGNEIIDGVAHQEVLDAEGIPTLMPVSTAEHPNVYSPADRFNEYETNSWYPGVSKFINERGDAILEAADGGEGFAALQREVAEWNETHPDAQVDPDEFSNFFDEFYTPGAEVGEGITGTRGYGYGDSRNLEQMNLDALRKYRDEKNAALLEGEKLAAEVTDTGLDNPTTIVDDGNAKVGTGDGTDKGDRTPVVTDDAGAKTGGTGMKAGEVASLAGTLLPTVYNLAQGMGKSTVYQPDYISLDRINYTDMSDPARQRVRGSVRTAMESGQGHNASVVAQNAAVNKMAGDKVLNEIDLGELGRYDAVAKANTDIGNREEMINLGQMEKAQRKTDLALKNKKEYTEAGIQGIARVADDLYTRGLHKSRDAKADDIQGSVLEGYEKTFPFLYGENGLDPDRIALLKSILS